MEQEVTFNEYGNTRQILLLKQPPKKRLSKMRNNEILKIDELLEEVYFLREENKSLHVDYDFLQRQNAALKQRCREQSQRLLELESEVADLKFVRKCFGPMTTTNSDVRLQENGVNTTSLGDDY